MQRCRNALAILSVASWLIAPSATMAQEVVSAYTVTVTLSPAAAQKLSTSGEQIHVAAMYYGTARPGVKGDTMGQIGLARQDVDIAKAGPAALGAITLSAPKLRNIKGRPEVLINVYTSRKVFPDNLLACDVFQDDPKKAAAGITIPCKLIGEK